MDANALTKENYLSILRQKLDALTKMLEATKRLDITAEGDDDNMVREAELYASLYEQRADMIVQIQKMDEALSLYKDLEEKFAKASQPVLDKIKETARAMVELDKAHMEKSGKILQSLGLNLKKIRDGRDINNAYLDMSNTSGYHLDTKN